ncbi:MAG: carbohydrate ABC transporter permease [Christensenellales bacterium]|jgi:putative aldouronate transport system permease protein
MISIKRKNRKINSIPNYANFLIHFFFVLWSVLCIVPVLLVLGISFSSESSILTYGYEFIPTEFSTSSYEYAFGKAGMLLKAYGISIMSTVIGTGLSLIVMTMFAYPLSRKYFKYRKFFSFILFFTMIFSGGTVATYMIFTQVLRLKNNYLVYIWPYLMSAWNVIILRTFITNTIPDELSEAAKIDGAGEFRILATIVVPLLKPGIATVGLFTAIGIWNDWYTPSLYVTDINKFNMQYVLYSMLTNIQFLKNNMDKVGGSSSAILANMPTEGIRMAMTVLVIAPIIVAYPFFQRYFVRGITIGAVKG